MSKVGLVVVNSHLREKGSDVRVEIPYEIKGDRLVTDDPVRTSFLCLYKYSGESQTTWSTEFQVHRDCR